MKKIVLFLMTLCIAFNASAQDVPYSKYLTFDKQAFKENRFKYDEETNTWAFVIMTIIAIVSIFKMVSEAE